MAILGKSTITELTVNNDLEVLGNLSAGNVEDSLTNNSAKIPSSKAVYESTIQNAEATVEKIAGNLDPEVTVSTENRVSTFHFKIPSGSDGKNLTLSANTLYFKVDNDGIPVAGQTCTLLIHSSGITTSSITWTNTQGFSIPAGTTSYELTSSSVTGKLPVSFTVSAEGLTDTITINPLESGEAPYLLDISPSTIALSADSAGTVKSSQYGTIATAKVFCGNEDVSSDFSYTASTSTITASVGSTTGAISVTSLTADYGTITVTASKNGVSLSKQLRVVRVKDGVNGSSAGFGTPTASATLLSPTSQPTVSVSATGSNTSKVFDFDFGIPRSAPIFGYLTCNSINIACDSNGVPITGSGSLIGTNTTVSSFKVLSDNVDVTSSYTFTIGSGGTTSTTVGGFSLIVNTSGNIIINSASGTTSSNVQIPVTARSGNITLTQTLWLIKINQGSTGTPGEDGADGADGSNISNVTASVSNTVGTPSVQVSYTGANNAKTINFAFSNLKGERGATGPMPTLASSTGTSTTSAMTQKATTDAINAVDTKVTSLTSTVNGLTLKKLSLYYTFSSALTSWNMSTQRTGGTAYSSVPSDAQVIVFYNGLELVPDLEYTRNGATITLVNSLGGVGSNQTLSAEFFYT